MVDLLFLLMGMMIVISVKYKTVYFLNILGKFDSLEYFVFKTNYCNLKTQIYY